MGDPNLINREDYPPSKAAEWAYRSSDITFFGIIPYLFFSFCALVRIEHKSLETMLLLKLGFKRVWKNTVLPFLILGVLFLIFLLVDHMSSIGFPARCTTSQTNLDSLRSAIQMYNARVGAFPSDDLRELLNVRFEFEGQQRSMLNEIPPEFISRTNSPNNKIYNELNSEGGWYYERQTGAIRINYNKPLDESFRQNSGENPAQW